MIQIQEWYYHANILIVNYLTFCHTPFVSIYCQTSVKSLDAIMYNEEYNRIFHHDFERHPNSEKLLKTCGDLLFWILRADLTSKPGPSVGHVILLKGRVPS